MAVCTRLEPVVGSPSLRLLPLSLALALLGLFVAGDPGEREDAVLPACTVPHPTNPNYMLEGAAFHYKLALFFSGVGPPPLEEVFFATQNLTRATQQRLQQECPGLLVTAFIMLAEALLPVAPEEAYSAFAKADALSGDVDSAESMRKIEELWPVTLALASHQQAVARISAVPERTPVVHLVVCHCRESLEWLGSNRLHMPAPDRSVTRLFVYEKCSKTPENLADLRARFASVDVVPVDDGDVRRDECSGYLRHLVDHYAEPPDFSLFFQADAGDHMEWGYLSLVMRAIERHSLDVEFIHLNHPRLVASLSPCRAKVFEQVFDRMPRQMLGSYCCAQFLVSRKRWLANPIERYQRMNDMLFGESPAECHDIPGHSTHCLMFEVYWHVLFGEPDNLPERAENRGLPLMLRTRDLENESYLPGGSLYYQYVMEV